MKMYEEFYTLVERIAELTQLLQDERSKQVFWTRLKADINPTWRSLRELILACGIFSDASVRTMTDIWLRVKQASAEGKPLFLYGAGEVATGYVNLFRNEGVSFSGFCDSYRCGGEHCGKPIISPAKMVEQLHDGLVLITTAKYHSEIASMLRELGVGDGKILHCFETIGDAELKSAPEQYFEFPELIPRGSVFVDGGCFDGADSIRFSNAVSGAYSKIVAFEPDGKNRKRCEARFREAGINRAEVISACLSDQNGTLPFSENGTGGSHLILDERVPVNVLRVEGELQTEVCVTALDTFMDTPVGMIKLDIEGAELSALHGMRETIRRDRPFMAVCVYHLRGDVLAIMNELNRLVPEYRFWLRHYSASLSETVLYAAI